MLNRRLLRHADRTSNKPTPDDEHLSKHGGAALKYIVSRDDSSNCVIALPPSGLLGGYWELSKIRGCDDCRAVDKPENILKRITFYDDDSRLMETDFDRSRNGVLSRKIKGDISYFIRLPQSAHVG